MLRLLIVGYGNPFRSDDGLGWHIARQLSHDFSRDDIQVIAAHQLMPEIAEAVSRAEQVLFIDAALHGTPGSLSCTQLSAASSASLHTHKLSPAIILRLARDLYGRCPSAQLFTVTGESFETGETMSPAVVAAIPGLIEQIKLYLSVE
jgi:hydrogenase maturation protease